MKDTLVVNLIASPGVGKSTMASDIFSKLKWDGVDCELVSEFAKELVWEERKETFKDELYLFSKQNHRLFRINNKVDIIITDRPIILSSYYNDKYGDGSDAFSKLVLETHNKYRNLNFILKRIKKYNPNGRNQTENESNKMQEEIIDHIKKLGIKFESVKANQDGVLEIIDKVLKEV